MKTQGKRFRAAESKVDKTREYPVSEAAKILKDSAFAKFNETVDVVCGWGSIPGTPTRSSAAPWRCRTAPASRSRCWW